MPDAGHCFVSTYNTLMEPNSTRIEDEHEKPKEVLLEDDNEILTRKLERLWKTDFADAMVDTKVIGGR